MSTREQQVNDALRVLDDMHRTYRIERSEYRRRRGLLLASLSDTSERAGDTERDTVRRAVHAGDAASPVEKPVAAAETRGRARRGGLRRAAMYLAILLAVAMGCAAAWWFATAS